MIDWKKKLTSRKFWAALAGFITGLVVFIKQPTSDAQAITALIMSIGTLVAYILGEGLIDAAAAHGSNTIILPEQVDEEEDEDPEEDAEI